jgi:dienelactone hydrolase
VDSQHIGLAGSSLGAALALAAAGEEDPERRQIATLVALFGCLPPDMRTEIRGLPPTLMIQGDVDEQVPPWAVYDFETWLKRKKLPVEFKMCQRVGHVFDGARLQDIQDAQDLIEAFLKTRLRPRSPGPPLLDAPVSRQGAVRLAGDVGAGRPQSDLGGQKRPVERRHYTEESARDRLS